MNFNFIERIKLNAVHIQGRGHDDVYLSRYWLIGDKNSRFAVMLHKMHRPDDDACHHDHPWSFWTFVLWGGYVEDVTHRTEVNPPYADWGTVIETVKRRFNRPGMLLFRRATHTHRIHKLPKGSCWTLVLRFKYKRAWGFWTKMGWKGWEYFLAKRSSMGVAWCGTEKDWDSGQYGERTE